MGDSNLFERKNIQTFLPNPDFVKTAQILDRARLGKSRVECLQILQVLHGETKAWANHPAVKMWCGHETSLVDYGIAICNEWISRGYKDTCKPRILSYYMKKDIFGHSPKWLGNELFHSSHRAALLAKMPEHYGRFGWSELPKIEYWWPTKQSLNLGNKYE